VSAGCRSFTGEHPQHFFLGDADRQMFLAGAGLLGRSDVEKMRTITIPGAVVPYIRGGAQLQIAEAAEQLATVIGEAMYVGVAPLGERRQLLQA
jgi:hypothetical protein